MVTGRLLVIIFLMTGYSAFAQTTYKPVCQVTGKMYVGENSTPTQAALYVGGHIFFSSTTDILQRGKTILLGDFVNNVSGGNIFHSLSDGIFEFKGEKAQHVLGNADKVENYINFPDLIINNRTSVIREERDTSAVFVASNIGLSARNINLVRGRLILESDVINDPVTLNEKTSLAHLLVHNVVNYPSDNSRRSIDDKGLIQVDLILREEYGNGGLIGFTPPFKKIYNDYFFFNMVSKPTEENIFGRPPQLYRTPMDSLIAGRGYFVGLGAIPLEIYDEAMNPEWLAAEPSDRYADKLLFLRDYAPISLMQFVNTDGNIKDAWSAEVINTEDITVTLEKGRNFLGNPFTVPIDLEKIIRGGGYDSEWDININEHLENRFIILKEGKSTFKRLGDNIDDPFSYNFVTVYDTISTVQGTGGNKNTLIAPMQMFIVEKKTEGTTTMKIPASARTHGNASFLRSSLASDLFASMSTTGNELIEDKPVRIYYQDNTIIINGLKPADAGHVVRIYDIGGRLIKQSIIKDIPIQQITVMLDSGMYMVSMHGPSRTVSKMMVR